MPASQVIIDRLDALLRQRPEMTLNAKYLGGHWIAELRAMTIHGVNVTVGTSTEAATLGDALAEVYDAHGRKG